MATLDKTGLAYLWSKLKTKLNGKSDVGHGHPEYLTQAQVEALIESKVLNGYLDGKQIRYVDNANDGGIEGYLTIKKG